MDAALYSRIKSLRDSGHTYKRIAELTGERESRVVNVCLGRVKMPGQRRADAGRSKYGRTDEIVEAAKQFYMQQGRRKGNLSACIDMALDSALQHGVFVPKPTLRRLVDAAFHSERWDI